MSGKRSEILATNEIYHVYNKTVGYEEIFNNSKELKRFISLIDYYRFNPKLSFSKYNILPSEERKKFYQKIKTFPKVVDIFAFAIMPNHFHLLMKQIDDSGIQKFLSNIQNGFAKYFNLKNKRSGTLFQKSFKAKRILNDEIFLHLSRYIHLNPITSYLISPEKLINHPCTSYPYYFGNIENNLINTKPIIEIVRSKDKYIKFVNNQIDYQRKLQKIKKYILE